MNLIDLPKNFSTEEAAIKFLESKLWPDGPVCPHCGLLGEAFRMQSKRGTKNKMRPGLWKCSGCRKTFRVTVDTIFEDSHIPLHKWLMAIHLMCASKKGMSAHQLHRMLGLGYRAAWFMGHRIRWAMTYNPLSPKLSGIVEADETYIGGKMKTVSTVKPGERPKDRLSGLENKAAVFSLVQRRGRVRSQHVERVTAENLKPVIREIVAEDTHLITDSSTVLEGAAMGMKHDQVNHRAGEYVRYENGACITTNSVEGYFATLKRGINGVYHHVGKQHLHRYLTEFDFRYNSRDSDDGTRTLLAVKETAGKRLMYRDSCVRA